MSMIKYLIKGKSKLFSLLNIFGRFSLVGMLTTSLYFFTANLLIFTNALTPIYASSTAFLLTIPISFYGHGNFTFQIKKQNFHQLKIYIVYTIFGFTVSNCIIFLSTLTSLLNAHIGIAMVTILLPMINFLALKYLVFPKND